MKQVIREVDAALRTLKLPSIWSPDVKASENVIPLLLTKFYSAIGMKVPFNKRDYWKLIDYLDPSEVDPEIINALDLIYSVATTAEPS
jgi:hypothetical protein